MRISRRKFVRAAGATVIIAGIPAVAHLARAARSAPADFGGPTPNGDFYVTSFGGTPSVDPAAWSFRIKGLVDNPIDLTYEQVKSLPQINEELTLECISNPPDGTAISNANWQGVLLSPLLDKARVNRRAVWVAMRGADGYYTGLPVDELMRPENFLPWKMNGVPLPPPHGFPLRIFIPGKYGMKQPKWITELEFLDHETSGYWEARGWSNSAWRKVNSGFFSPRVAGGLFSIFDRSAQIKAPAYIWGWALAGPSGIKRVQVSTDNGASWHDADLVRNKSVYVWTVWKYRFAPKSTGKYVVRVKATDGSGVVQPPVDPQTGSGMSGQPRIAVEVTSVA
jgi:DMSO/TMAO reductase YedYZ molybdopterin-dependent catalytic subunit